MILLLLTGCGLFGFPNVATPSLTVDLEEGERLFNPVTIDATVSDPGDRLYHVAVRFRSDRDDTLCRLAPGTTGHVSCTATLQPGPHLLTVTATDQDGRTDTVSRAVLVDVWDTDDTGWPDTDHVAGDTDDSASDTDDSASDTNDSASDTDDSASDTASPDTDDSASDTESPDTDDTSAP